MKSIVDRGWRDALIEYVSAGRPFLGICLGMQCLFEGSDESADAGLGIIPGLVTRFDPEETASGPSFSPFYFPPRLSPSLLSKLISLLRVLADSLCHIPFIYHYRVSLRESADTTHRMEWYLAGWGRGSCPSHAGAYILW